MESEPHWPHDFEKKNSQGVWQMRIQFFFLGPDDMLMGCRIPMFWSNYRWRGIMSQKRNLSLVETVGKMCNYSADRHIPHAPINNKKKFKLMFLTVWWFMADPDRHTTMFYFRSQIQNFSPFKVLIHKLMIMWCEGGIGPMECMFIRLS